MRDDLDLDPRVGTVGFRGWAAEAPPARWIYDHVMAETGGYLRIGSRWGRRGVVTVPLFGMPWRVLYTVLIDRIGVAAAFEMGWCVDAD